MTPTNGQPSDLDYLWNPAAEPDADVEAIERSLESLRFESRARPLMLPRGSRVRWRPMGLAVAASFIVVLVLCATFWQWRESWPTSRAWSVTFRATRTAPPDVSTLAVDHTLQLDEQVSAEVDIAR